MLYVGRTQQCLVSVGNKDGGQMVGKWGEGGSKMEGSYMTYLHAVEELAGWVAHRPR